MHTKQYCSAHASLHIHYCLHLMNIHDCSKHSVITFFSPVSVTFPPVLLAMTSIERFIGIYFPFKAKEICSLKITRRIIIGLVVVFLLFESQLLFIVDGVKGEDNSTVVDCGPASNSKSSFEIYKHMDSVLYSYLPLTVMIVCNIGIITKLILAKTGRRQKAMHYQKEPCALQRCWSEFQCCL